MKRLSARLLSALLLVGVAVGASSPAHAASTANITVTADAYALDGSGQITSNSEFLYDSAKGDTASTAYQIAYRGNLKLDKLWQKYRTFKSLWLLGSGNTEVRWAEKTFRGEWDISFTIDPSIVTSDPSFVSCTALQAEIEAQNPVTELSSFIRCTDVSYDEQTGLYAAHFELINEDGSKVTGEQLDNNQPASLHLTTPGQAFYVKQSAFEADKTFIMTAPTVTGSMTMDAMQSPLLPINFHAVGNDVGLTMTETHDAEYAFVSETAGRALPTEVTALLPATQTMIMNGTTVTPPTPASTSVAVPQGVWSFTGWSPATATVNGANVSFTGGWSFQVDPDAQFTVTYSFLSADGSDLPSAVIDLLPPQAVATQGSTVTPPPVTPAEITTPLGTWNFSGWNHDDLIIDGFDIEFVGLWSFTKAQVEPEVPAVPDPEPLPTKPPTTEPTDPLAQTGASFASLAPMVATATLLLAGAVTLLKRTRRQV